MASQLDFCGFKKMKYKPLGKYFTIRNEKKHPSLVCRSTGRKYLRNRPNKASVNYKYENKVDKMRITHNIKVECNKGKHVFDEKTSFYSKGRIINHENDKNCSICRPRDKDFSSKRILGTSQAYSKIVPVEEIEKDAQQSENCSPPQSLPDLNRSQMKINFVSPSRGLINETTYCHIFLHLEGEMRPERYYSEPLMNLKLYFGDKLAPALPLQTTNDFPFLDVLKGKLGERYHLISSSQCYLSATAPESSKVGPVDVKLVFPNESFAEVVKKNGFTYYDTEAATSSELTESPLFLSDEDHNDWDSPLSPSDDDPTHINNWDLTLSEHEHYYSSDFTDIFGGTKLHDQPPSPTTSIVPQPPTFTTSTGINISRVFGDSEKDEKEEEKRRRRKKKRRRRVVEDKHTGSPVNTFGMDDYKSFIPEYGTIIPSFHHHNNHNMSGQKRFLRLRHRQKRSIYDTINTIYDLEGDTQTEQTDKTCCHCNGPLFGKMIGCENENCKIGCFHFQCVGLKAAPDVWYCKECRVQLNFVSEVQEII